MIPAGMIDPQIRALTAAPDRETRWRSGLLLLALWGCSFGVSTLLAVAILFHPAPGQCLTAEQQLPAAVITTAAVLQWVALGGLVLITIALTPPGRRRPRTLWGWILTIGWAGCVIGAAMILGTNRDGFKWVESVLIGVAVWTALRWAMPQTTAWFPALPQHSRRTALVIAGAFLASLVFMALLMDFLRGLGVPPAPHAWCDENSDYSDALAGLQEEPLLTAAAVVLGRRAGWTWRTTVGVALTLRVAFHLYYGWLSVAVVVWAAVLLLLWTTTRNVWAMIVGHGLYNLLLSLSLVGSSVLGMVIIGLLLVGGADLVQRRLLRSRVSPEEVQDLTGS